EPDSHLSFMSQVLIWNMLEAESRKNNIQIIVASHSPLPLFYKGANIISFEKDYVGTDRIVFATKQSK
ncbi:MAG: hypothetical protein KKD07_10180, partial [Candidatus Omnitrophica bacterium]|nr:hypothetical protein [Candidatus Omnitrophota bacterium]